MIRSGIGDALAPSWVDDLSGACHELKRSDSDDLSLDVVLAEFIDLASSLTSKHWSLKELRAARKSLADDFTSAVQHLGPLTANVLATPIAATTLRLVAAKSGSDPAPAVEAARKLQWELGATPVLDAAFRDLIDAFQGPLACDVRSNRLADLVMLIRSRQQDWERATQTVVFILAGNALVVFFAQVALGERLPTDARPDPQAECGVAFETRVDLARRWLEQDVQSGHCRAWILFEEASLGGNLLLDANARLQYADARIVFESAKSEEKPTDREIVRLLRPFVNTLPPYDDKRDDLIVAYVDMGHRPVAGARNDARTTALLQPDLAAWATDAARWLPAGWELLAVDDSASDAHFMPDHRMNDWTMKSRRSEGLGDWMHRNAALDGSPEEFAALGRAVNDLNQSRTLNDVARVLATVRVAETLGLSIRFQWRDVAISFRDDWIVHEIVQRAINVYWGATHGLFIEEAVRDEVKRIAAACVTFHHRGHTFDLTAIFDNAAAIVDVLRFEPLAQRDATEFFASIKTPATFGAVVDENRRRFNLLVNRVGRVRDAATHGHPISEAAAASTSSFVRFVGGRLIAAHLTAMGGHVTVGDAVKKHKQKSVDRLRLAQSSDDPAAALFPAGE